MKNKRILATIFSLVIISLCSCGGQGSTQSSATEDYREEIKSNSIVVGFSQVGSESDWRRANTMSYKETFTEDKGFHLIYDDAQQKQENQLKAVRKFILQQVDYIILDPIVETGWDEVLKEAKQAKIPVIIVDRQVSADPDLYTCWVGSDFYNEGLKAGQWLASYLRSQGKSEENINIVSLQGTIGSTSQIGRTNGFEEELNKHSNWTLLERVTGDYTMNKGQEVMTEFLNKYKDIDVLISENDDMSLGAIKAIKAAGKTSGVNGDITIVSYDGLATALKQVQSGEINVIFECNTQLGPMVAKIIKSLEAGEKIEKINYIEESYYDTTMDLTSVVKEKESYMK